MKKQKGCRRRSHATKDQILRDDDDVVWLTGERRLALFPTGSRLRIDKCEVLAMRRGKESECEEITLGSREVIAKIDDDGYKYLGIMKRTLIFQEQMKRSVKTEYFKRVKSTLKLKLNAGNVFQAINTSAVLTVLYGAKTMQRTKEELQQVDRKTRKLTTIYGGLYPWSCVDRLYITRSDVEGP